MLIGSSLEHQIYGHFTILFVYYFLAILCSYIFQVGSYFKGSNTSLAILAGVFGVFAACAGIASVILNRTGRDTTPK